MGRNKENLHLSLRTLSITDSKSSFFTKKSIKTMPELCDKVPQQIEVFTPEVFTEVFTPVARTCDSHLYGHRFKRIS